MEDIDTTALAWTIIGASAGVALVLCLVGALRVIPRARSLKRRLALYAYLPIVRAMQGTRTRLESLQLRTGEVNALLVRAQAALTQIQTALASLKESGIVVATAFNRVRSAVGWFMRFLGWPSRALRSRGS